MSRVPRGRITAEQLETIGVACPIDLRCEPDLTLGLPSRREEETAGLVVLIGIGSRVEAVRSIALVVIARLELEVSLPALHLRLPEKIQLFEIGVVGVAPGMGITGGEALTESPFRLIHPCLYLPELVHTGIVIGRDRVGLTTFCNDIDRSRKGTGAKHTGGGS